MSKTKFWFGLLIGTIGGLLAAKKYPGVSRMPGVRTWQRIFSTSLGEIDAALFKARIENQYKELFSQKPVFNNLVFDFHIKHMLLPGLAIYRTLLSDGMDQDNALEEIDRLYKIWFELALPFNIRPNQLLKFTPKNFTTLRRGIRLITDNLFQEPGWRYKIQVEDNNSLAFDMHECFYMKVLNYYNAPELTFIYCKLDDYLMDAMPAAVKWGRTQTMGLGADFCDFRWEQTERADPQKQ